MNWSDERYVRLYTRDTPDWLALSFDAQALFALLMRKVDRAGVLELGKHGKRAVAIAIGHASAWERLAPALEELLTDGCVSVHGDKLLVRNFIEAQEARQSDRKRQAESRSRRREQLAGQRLLVPDVTNRDVESQNVTESHDGSHDVTTGHSESQPVTPYRAVPSVPEIHTSGPNPTLPGIGDAKPERPPVPAVLEHARTDAASWLEWFNRTFGRQFELRPDLVKQVRALHARGFAERDMRLVAVHKRSQWEDNPKMREFLRPDSLLVASKFGQRLDEAREWWGTDDY